MEDVHVPVPNPFITQWLLGPICRDIVLDLTGKYRDLYMSIVAIRTAALATSATVSLDVEDGRWTGVMSVGDEVADYGLSHEYGTGRTDPKHNLPAAHDLNTILNMMATL